MEKKKNCNVWMIVSLILFLAVAFLGYNHITQKEEIDNVQSKLNASEDDLAKTSSDLFSMRDKLIEQKKKYKALGMEKDDLDKQIAELDTYIAKLKNEAEMSEKEKAKLRSYAAGLKAEIAKKDEEIKVLIAKNDSLGIEIDTLVFEKQELSNELETVTIAKTELNDFIKAASVLKVDDMKISALKASGKEFVKEEYKAKSIDRLKIQFSIADNKAAQKDNKAFYIRLILPSGEVFSDKYNGGGTTTLTNGNEVRYTMMKNLQFDNSGQSLTFTMLKGFNYTSGNYIVEVVCEGAVIGSGYFNVK